jgi:hypothetical protein
MRLAFWKTMLSFPACEERFEARRMTKWMKHI